MLTGIGCVVYDLELKYLIGEQIFKYEILRYRN